MLLCFALNKFESHETQLVRLTCRHAVCCDVICRRVWPFIGTQLTYLTRCHQFYRPASCHRRRRRGAGWARVPPQKKLREKYFTGNYHASGIFGPGNGSPMATNVVLLLLSFCFLWLLLSDFRSNKAFLFHNRSPSNFAYRTDWWQYYPQSHRDGFSS